MEVVRRIVRAFGERDHETATEPLDPRIKWDATRSRVESKTEALEAAGLSE